jgi:large exoprotein involved in heme utilization and adhesion
MKLRFTFALMTGVAAIALAPPAVAQLSGLAVAAGQAALSTTAPGASVIRQTTEKAILNWQSFSIASGNSVQFVQPNAAAIALNRVLGPGA